MLTGDETSSGIFPTGFERLIVARTLSTWNGSDGSVYLQVADPWSEYLAFHAGQILEKLPSVEMVEPEQLPAHAVAASPKATTELAAALKNQVNPGESVR